MKNLRFKLWKWMKIDKYRNPTYRVYLHYYRLIKSWWDGRHLRRAKKLAIAWHKEKGKTYYVLPNAEGIPEPFNEREIRKMKKLGLMNKRVNCVDLYKEALFIANSKTTNK